MNELLEQVEALLNLLVSRATGGNESSTDYLKLRKALLQQPSLEPLVPRFVRTCRSLSQFWEYVKSKFESYQKRRQFLWDEFRPLLEQLESGTPIPSDKAIGEGLGEFDEAHIQALWSKALDRRHTDAEGAITMARTLLESVCKYILDDAGKEYDEGTDLPRLYHATSKVLQLAPSQHTQKEFKQILGGCASVVQGLGALRNRLSDSHGGGRQRARPAPRHAELAVNLAGAMANYLVSTWKFRQESDT